MIFRVYTKKNVTIILLLFTFWYIARLYFPLTANAFLLCFDSFKTCVFLQLLHLRGSLHWYHLAQKGKICVIDELGLWGVLIQTLNAKYSLRWKLIRKQFFPRLLFDISLFFCLFYSLCFCNIQCGNSFSPFQYWLDRKQTHSYIFVFMIVFVARNHPNIIKIIQLFTNQTSLNLQRYMFDTCRRIFTFLIGYFPLCLSPYH